MPSVPRSVRVVAGFLGTCVVFGWLFYVVGLDAFLEAAYQGESLEYFNDFAARWRYRQSSPQLQAFLRDARALLFRLGVLGTGISAVLIGGTVVVPEKIRRFVSFETSPYNLALFRILLFGTLLAFNLDVPAKYAHLPQVLQSPPPGTGLLTSLPSDPTTASRTSLLFQIACISGLLGFYTRTSAAIATVTGWYLLGIPQLYGKVNHYHHLIWFTGLMAVSPAGDVLSLDAARNAWRTPSVKLPRQAADYARPLRYVWLLLGLIYFFPGFWKFASEGVAWAFSENLKYRMHTLWFASDSFRPLFRLDRVPGLYQSAALATMLFESGFFFTVPFPSLRPWAAGAALLFHQSTKWILNIYFWSLPPLLLSLFNLRTAATCFGRWLHPSPLSLSYDDDIDWQRRIVAVFRRFDVFDRLRPSPSPASTASLHVAGSPSSALWTNGRPNPQKLLHLCTYVPAAVPLVPLAWIVSPSRTSSPPSQPDAFRADSSSRWPIVIVGSLLLTANVICGLGHVHSWPFSVYPTFAVRSDSLISTIHVEAVDAAGQSVDVFSTNEEASSIGLSPERARGLTRSILLASDEHTQTTKLKALWSVWRPRNARLEHVTTVRFYKVVYPTTPPFRTPDPVSKTQLAELSVQ